jgi:deferrochelatase/peroxidase EfeB
VAGVGLAACTTDDGAADDGQARRAIAAASEPRYVDLHGIHQTGITTAAGAYGLVAAFTSTADDRAELIDVMHALTSEARAMMRGDRYEEREPAYPVTHTGTLGDRVPPADLSVVVSVGPSLFDDRYGLGRRRPRELVEMPYGLGNDRLDAAQTHGDLLVSISADSADVGIFALRQLMRRTRGGLVLRWMVEGFNRRDPPAPGRAGVRNLLGFRDGTANLDTGDDALMDRYVWVADGDGEPAWAAGGSYHVVRVIRMRVELWDRTSLAEQEAIIGRHKATGAPIGLADETDPVDFAADPDGRITALDAHIRLANPRTPASEENLILRRGFSFSRGFDGAGRLDQGLLFASFQRSLESGFLAVQARLKGEPLEEYIQPVGGGFFFALPGVRDERDWIGRALLTVGAAGRPTMMRP